MTKLTACLCACLVAAAVRAENKPKTAPPPPPAAHPAAPAHAAPPPPPPPPTAARSVPAPAGTPAAANRTPGAPPPPNAANKEAKPGENPLAKKELAGRKSEVQKKDLVSTRTGASSYAVFSVLTPNGEGVIFHRRGCTLLAARQTKEYANRGAALSFGLQPCVTCRP